MLSLAIFDLDGTICDTIDDIGDGLNGMLSEKGHPLLTRTDVLQNINNGAFELVRRSLPEEYRDNTEYVKEALSVYEKYYSKCYDNKTYPFEGVAETIIELKNKGLKLAVLSNKQDSFVKNIIKKIFPEGLFDIILGDGPFPSKPDPTSALYICKTLGCDPKNCAMVGDSHVDMLTAKNAGLIAVGVTWGYRSREVLIEYGAKYLIDETRELIKLSDI